MANGESGPEWERADGGDALSGSGSNTESQSGTSSRRARVRRWFASHTPSLLSSRSLLVAVVLAFTGLVLVGTVPLLGSVPYVGLLGIALGTFVHGLVANRSRYVEAGLAGACAGAGSILVGYLLVVIVGDGTRLVAAGFLTGALAGLAGHYFGRDLRDGLTGEVA